MPHDHADAETTDHHAFSGPWWEAHHRSGEQGSIGTASPYVVDAVANLRPGTVLDAGCGTGADAVWLAERGWDVTAVDVSATAIDRARAFAPDVAPAVAQRLTWVVADMTTWDPPRRFDLVVSQYVHPDAPFDRFARRLAGTVAPGGTLLIVGHDHADPHSRDHAPRDASLGIAAVTAVLDPGQWDVEIADTRERRIQQGSHDQAFVDTVVRARRRSPVR